MLFLLFGSSAAGKTFALSAVRERLPELAIHDFDEVGVPPRADASWRHRSNEVWVRRALGYQSQGVDLLLAAQTPLGELLAAPSAPLLEAISACLVDCDDEIRVARLRARGPEWFGHSAGDLQDYLDWGEWMRRHAGDPSWRQDVIRKGDVAHKLRWERWSDWKAGDPRWRVRVIDTSALSVDRVATELAAWIQEERTLFRAGVHPLSAWAGEEHPARSCGPT